MPAIGKALHEEELDRQVMRLRSAGYKIIKLDGKCPDAIATKDDKLVAIEIMPRYFSARRGGEWKGWHSSMKLKMYSSLGFDEVLVFEYRKPYTGDSKSKRNMPKQFTPAQYSRRFVKPS